MIDYKLLKENGIAPKKIKKINNCIYIDTGKEKYILKAKKENIKDCFNYLLSRNFHYFPKHMSIRGYDVYEYIEERKISKEEKLNEIVDLISLLHVKTTRYKNNDIDDYKKIYENLENQLNGLEAYYSEINDVIDSEIYMSPSHYLLVLNISKIYSAIYFCKDELEKWYDIVKNNPKQRVVFIHNNLDIDHLLMGDKPYLISWDKSKIDLPIYDLIELYNNGCTQMDFNILFKRYLQKYPLKKEELKLFFIKISIPDKIEFGKDEYENTQRVKKMFEQLTCGENIIYSYYSENLN